MSEKQDSSCASQQEKEKKSNNTKTKHTKKTHTKDWYQSFNVIRSLAKLIVNGLFIFAIFSYNVI